MNALLQEVLRPIAHKAGLASGLIDKEVGSLDPELEISIPLFPVDEEAVEREVKAAAESCTEGAVGPARHRRHAVTAGVDDDVDALSRYALAAEVRRLRAGIRKHRDDSTAQELCWHHPELWGPSQAMERAFPRGERFHAWWIAIAFAVLTSGCYVENRRLQGNTAMTARMLDDLFYALARYEQVCGGYPATLEPLERPRAGSTTNCDHLGTFVDAVRAGGVFQEGDKLGMFQDSVDDLARLRERGIYREYRFQYAPRELRSNGRYGGYVLSADPVERGVTGMASFWVSELGEVRRNWERNAGPSDLVYREVARRPSPLP